MGFRWWSWTGSNRRPQACKYRRRVLRDDGVEGKHVVTSLEITGRSPKSRKITRESGCGGGTENSVPPPLSRPAADRSCAKGDDLCCRSTSDVRRWGSLWNRAVEEGQGWKAEGFDSQLRSGGSSLGFGVRMSGGTDQHEAAARSRRPIDPVRRIEAAAEDRSRARFDLHRGAEERRARREPRGESHRKSHFANVGPTSAQAGRFDGVVPAQRTVLPVCDARGRAGATAPYRHAARRRIRRRLCPVRTKTTTRGVIPGRPEDAAPRFASNLPLMEGRRCLFDRSSSPPSPSRRPRRRRARRRPPEPEPSPHAGGLRVSVGSIVAGRVDGQAVPAILGRCRWSSPSRA